VTEAAQTALSAIVVIAGRGDTPGLPVNPAARNGPGKRAVNCKFFGLEGGMILENAEKTNTCGQHLAERCTTADAEALVRSDLRISHRIRSRAGWMASTLASVPLESAAPDRTDSNRGPWLRVALTVATAAPGLPGRALGACGGDLRMASCGRSASTSA
jgi:hypothetical protein